MSRTPSGMYGYTQSPRLTSTVLRRQSNTFGRNVIKKYPTVVITIDGIISGIWKGHAVKHNYAN